jgi:hypothetical protein
MQLIQKVNCPREERARREQRLRLSVAARNFEGVPLFEALERIISLTLDKPLDIKLLISS